VKPPTYGAAALLPFAAGGLAGYLLVRWFVPSMP